MDDFGILILTGWIFSCLLFLILHEAVCRVRERIMEGRIEVTLQKDENGFQYQVLDSFGMILFFIAQDSDSLGWRTSLPGNHILHISRYNAIQAGLFEVGRSDLVY